jgi:hypothetical protein
MKSALMALLRKNAFFHVISLSKAFFYLYMLYVCSSQKESLSQGPHLWPLGLLMLDRISHLLPCFTTIGRMVQSSFG